MENFHLPVMSSSENEVEDSAAAFDDSYRNRNDVSSASILQQVISLPAIIMHSQGIATGRFANVTTRRGKAALILAGDSHSGTNEEENFIFGRYQFRMSVDFSRPEDDDQADKENLGNELHDSFHHVNTSSSVNDKLRAALVALHWKPNVEGYDSSELSNRSVGADILKEGLTKIRSPPEMSAVVCPLGPLDIDVDVPVYDDEDIDLSRVLFDPDMEQLPTPRTPIIIGTFNVSYDDSAVSPVGSLQIGSESPTEQTKDVGKSCENEEKVAEETSNMAIMDFTIIQPSISEGGVESIIEELGMQWLIDCDNPAEKANDHDHRSNKKTNALQRAVPSGDVDSFCPLNLGVDDDHDQLSADTSPIIVFVRQGIGVSCIEATSAAVVLAARNLGTMLLEMFVYIGLLILCLMLYLYLHGPIWLIRGIAD